MRRPSVSAGSGCWTLRKQQFDSRWRYAGNLTDVIVRLACAISLLNALAGPAPAADMSSVIALPDAPFVIPCVVSFAGQSNVTTELYNNARQGANLTETMLKPCNVQGATFGKLTQGQVKGQVLAQPLYIRDVNVDGFGRKNLVVVATAANIVYAFDANDLNTPLFQTNLAPTPQNSDPDPIEVDPNNHNSLTPVCAETYPPYIGVTSTPVIDAATGTVFVVSFNPRRARHELHALNLQHKFASGSPVTIVPILPPGQSEDVWSKSHRNRPGLLLSQGIIYTAFGSFICDHPQPYAGWVLGYRANDLTRVAQWETPDPGPLGSSGIWQSGRGLVASDDGDIYLMTGNDNNFDATLKDHTNEVDCYNDPRLDCFHGPRLANSFVKLSPGLGLVGSFTPKNTSHLSMGDTDLGSSGPILLPGGRLVGGGKQGRVYVIDPSTMRSLQNHFEAVGDGLQGFQAFTNTYHNDPAQPSCIRSVDPDNFCRQFPVPTRDLLNGTDCPFPGGNCFLPTSCYQHCQPYGPNIHAGFVYWQPAPDWGLLYSMPEKDYVKAFRYDLTTKGIKETPFATSQLRAPDGMPGGALSISANGRQDGILWVSMPNNNRNATSGVHRGSLVALDATDLHHLWEDPCIWYFAKFNPPTVADGRVFLATFAEPDPRLAQKPGENCSADDPPDPDFNHPDPQLKTSVGTAWIIEYGLK